MSEISNRSNSSHTLSATVELVTFHGDVDPRGEEQATETVVEDLVSLQSCRGMVGYLDT